MARSFPFMSAFPTASYRRFLWGTMDSLGIGDSIEQKFLAAVLIQFVSAMSLMLLPVAFLGPGRTLSMFPTAQIVATAVIVVLSVVAFGNTIWIVRRDILDPILELKAVADRISRGELTDRPGDPTQSDETGELKAAFQRMHDTLSTTAAQANALGTENFDAEVLDETVPGSFGDALSDMQRTLRRRITSLRKFQAGVHHAGHAIYMTDETGRIEYVNPAFEDLTGYEKSSIVGRDMEAFFAENIEDDVPSAMLDAMASQTIWRGELASRRSTGDRYVVEQTLAPIVDGEVVVGHVAISRDVTERKRYEAELEQKTEQLEALNRVIRHDISNDMNLILGWAQLLEDDVAEDGLELLSKLVDRSQHVVTLTEVVRDFVDAISDTKDLELHAVDLAGPLSKEIDNLRDAYPEATVTVEDDPGGCQVVANELLSSVFQNLLRNAIEHNDEETPQVAVSVDADSETVTIDIEDNGPGISDDRKDDIFGRGEQGLESAGTGIGLYLVDTLLDQYDGTVWIEDNDPKGSIFHVELQRAT